MNLQSARCFLILAILVLLFTASLPCQAADPSKIVVSVGTVAQLLVSDPAGNQTGLLNGSVAENIPNSDYGSESMDNLTTGQPDSHVTHVASIRQPVNGTYTIQVLGTQAGSYSVTVAAFNSDGTAQTVQTFSGTASVGSVDSYQYQYTNATPPLANVSLTNLVADSPSTSFTVKGLGFNSSSVVRWSGTDLPTKFVSVNQLSTTVPAALLGSAGTAAVTVVTWTGPDPGTTNAIVVTVNSPKPNLSALSPSSAVAGNPSFTLTIKGSKFVPGSIVNWNGSQLSTNWMSATKLTANVPASSITTVGTANISVTNPSPGGGTSGSLIYPIVAPTLSMVSLSKTSIIGGNSVSGTVTLTGPVPAGSGGWTVSLLSKNSAVVVPSSVTLAEGATTANFTITTKPVATDTPAEIDATYGSVTKTATLTVKAPALSKLTLSASTVKGGTSVTGKVTLSGVAAVDTVVKLSTTNPAATVPTMVTVPAGASAINFTITTVPPGTSSVTGSITANLGTINKSVSLTVTP